MSNIRGTYKLIPMDARKSFHGKAVVTAMEDGTQILTSYETDVCKCDADGNFTRLWDGWSATTQRHVNAFIQWNRCKAECGKKYWMEQEVE